MESLHLAAAELRLFAATATVCSFPQFGCYPVKAATKGRLRAVAAFLSRPDEIRTAAFR